MFDIAADWIVGEHVREVSDVIQEDQSYVESSFRALWLTFNL